MSNSKEKRLDDFEDLKSEHQCPVCLCDYDEDGPHKPLLLKCAHTVCRQCIMDIIDLSCVTCPICRKNTYVPPDDVDVELNRNYTMSTVGSLIHLVNAKTAMYAELLRQLDEAPLDQEIAIQDVQEEATALQEPRPEQVRIDTATSAGTSTAPLQSAGGRISILPPRRVASTRKNTRNYLGHGMGHPLGSPMERNSREDWAPASNIQRCMNDRDLPMFPFESPPRYETVPDRDTGRKRRSDPGRYVERIDDQPTYPHSSRQNASNPELHSRQVFNDVQVPKMGAGTQRGNVGIQSKTGKQDDRRGSFSRTVETEEETDSMSSSSSMVLVSSSKKSKRGRKINGRGKDYDRIPRKTVPSHKKSIDDSVMAEVNAKMRGGLPFSGPGKGKKLSKAAKSKGKTFTKNLFCCPNKRDFVLPDGAIWEKLENAGLGMRHNVRFPCGSTAIEVNEIILQTFPLLITNDGKEQKFFVCRKMRTRELAVDCKGCPNGNALENMVESLYLVPMQKDLEWEEDEDEVEDDDEDPLMVNCIFCNEKVLIDELDDHENICRRASKCYE